MFTNDMTSGTGTARHMNACPACPRPVLDHTDAEWLGCMAAYLATPYDPSEDERG